MDSKINQAYFSDCGLHVHLDYDPGDFWLDLGPCWGFFKGYPRSSSPEEEKERLMTLSGHDFRLREVRLKSEEKPENILEDYPILYAPGYPKTWRRINCDWNNVALMVGVPHYDTITLDRDFCERLYLILQGVLNDPEQSRINGLDKN